MAAATSALPGWPPLLPSVRSAAGPLIRRQHRWSSHLRAGPRPPFLRSQRRRSSARPLLPPARRAEAEELKARKNGGADDNGGVDQLARRQDHQSELTDAELHPAEKESPWRGRWSPTAGAATEEPARQPASHQLGLGHQLRSGKNPW
ncbi:unnamed protein product [Miscanthus lutarioriparius]|uniref:Uncharacterized protein n=1 Tax=Miscanthus lutarioriparius TaxID=422564 RepID=A0A811R5V7_9POAL|nr:unnamed protein product [Miscanthus lutarioriparius]